MKNSLEATFFKRTQKATAGKTAVACLLVFIMLSMAAFTGCSENAGSGAGSKDTSAMTTEELAELHKAEAAEMIESWEPAEVTEAMQTQRLIAHAGGSVDGYVTSNSVEALMNAVDNAYALVELDMGMTTDGHVVMVHDWDVTSVYYYNVAMNGPLSYDEFMALATYERFHTMDIESLIAVMDKSDTFRVVTDIKADFTEVLSKIAEDYPDYRDRFIVQIYNYDELEEVKAMGYESIILTVYNMQGALDPEVIADFYFDNKLKAITAPDEEYVDNLVKKLTGKGITVYRHPVSDYERMLALFDDTVYGIYTSSILPREILSDTANYYITMPAASPDAPKNVPGALAAKRGHLPGKLTAATPGKVKLTCYQVQGETVEDIVALEVHGLVENQYRIYYIGDEGERMTNQGLGDLPYGLIHMPVEIWAVDRPEGPGHFLGITLDYYLWKDEAGVSLFEGKYAYRAMNRRVIPIMDEALADVGKEAADILEKSFVACADEYYYYSAGESGISLCDDEYFYSLRGPVPNEDGSADVGVYVPIAEAAKALGADEVKLTDEGNILVDFSGEGMDAYELGRDSFPNMPYLKKTLICASELAQLAGRESIEDAGSGAVVILPKGVSASELTNAEQREILKAAAKLYGHDAE